MKNYFKSQSKKFLYYLENNLSYSKNTIYTYKINLDEALNYLNIEESDGVYLIDFMPYRLKIVGQNKKTIYKKISIVKSYANYLREKGISLKLLNDDNIKIPKTLPKPVARNHICEALRKCEIQEKILLKMAYSLGLRVSEISNLKIKSIKQEWVLIKGKGDKIRQLPLLKSLQEELFRYIEDEKPGVYLFEKSGKKLSENQIRYKIKKIFEKIGIRATPHQLRHAFASDLLQEGARITDVSELLGHSSLETTQIYTKLTGNIKMHHYKKAHPMCKERDGTV